MKIIFHYFYRFSIIIVTMLLLISCEGSVTQNMGQVSKTIKQIDTVTVKASKAVSKFSDMAEKYVDTSAYKKDSTGKWKKK